MSHPGFVAEFNQPPCYRAAFVQRLERAGLVVEQLPHKTLFSVRYGKLRKFSELKAAIARVMKHAKGSVFLVSHKTGRGWIMKVGGNRPREFVGIHDR